MCFVCQVRRCYATHSRVKVKSQEMRAPWLYLPVRSVCLPQCTGSHARQADYIIAVFVFTLMIYLFPSAVMYVYIPLEGVSAPVWCGLLSVQSIKERVKPSRLSHSIRRRRRRACMHARTHSHKAP